MSKAICLYDESRWNDAAKWTELLGEKGIEVQSFVSKELTASEFKDRLQEIMKSDENNTIVYLGKGK